jgi:hypothetical protein
LPPYLKCAAIRSILDGEPEFPPEDRAVNDDAVKETFDELFTLLEALETQSAPPSCST